MNTVISTFAVSSVACATQSLSEVPYRQALEHLLSQPLCQKKQRLQKEINFYHEWLRDIKEEINPIKQQLLQLKQQLADVEALEATATCSIETCSRNHGRLVADVFAHPVIDSLHLAFTQHRPFYLSPGIIWLLICQGVAHHVNAHAESLRLQFVQHQGKARIEVHRDDFIKGSPENRWDEVIDEFSLRIREHIGPVYDLFVPRFSTTSPAERIAAEIVLFDAMQCYFEYVTDTFCGIPAITLEGTVEDWQKLADRVQAFSQFDLDWWLTPLQPILQEFVATAHGTIRQVFWESIYKFQSLSGDAAVTGWITAFFPYFKDPQGRPTQRNPWLAEGGEKLKLLLAGEWDRKGFQGSPSPQKFPSGLARAPFIWNYLNQRFDMEFLGGFIGVAQELDTLTLRPEIGWAIRPGANVQQSVATDEGGIIAF